VAVTEKHNIGDALFTELGVKIPKETDHRWSEPLTEARLRYASDDVEHLETLYHDLLSKVEEDGMMEAYEVVRSVYPVYMRQQARGLPFDAELYKQMRARLKEKLEILDTSSGSTLQTIPTRAAGGSGETTTSRKRGKAATAP